MGYSADSFSAGEQPTTAKWNKLWSNDASFNDGTGIASLEIGSGHTSLKNDYKFSVYRNAALSIGSSATAKVTFDTKSFDTGSNFDAVTNNRFTAPVAGFYLFTSTVGFQPFSGDQLSIYFYKNGVVALNGEHTTTASTNDVWLNISHPFQLAATDYIEVFVSHTVAGVMGLNVGTSASTNFSGFLISQT
jgi:hypothetical protein